MRDAECVTGFAPHNRGLYMQQQASYFFYLALFLYLPHSESSPVS